MPIFNGGNLRDFGIIVNNINKDTSIIDKLFTFNSFEDIYTDEYFSTKKALDNLNNISDDDMSAESPIIVFERNEDGAHYGDLPLEYRAIWNYWKEHNIGNYWTWTRADHSTLDGLKVKWNTDDDYVRYACVCPEFNDTWYFTFNDIGFRHEGNTEFELNMLAKKSDNTIVELQPYYLTDLSDVDVEGARGVSHFWQERGEFWDVITGALTTNISGLIMFILADQLGVVNMDWHLQSNVWIFETEEEARNYLNTGDYSNALNYNVNYQPEQQEEDDTVDKTYYIHSDIWESSTPTETNKNYISHRWTEIKVNTDVNKRPFTLVVSDNQRMHLNINNVVQRNIISFRESDDEGQTWHNVTLSTFHNDWWRWNKILKKSAGVYQGAKCLTNIPVFDSDLKSNLYFDGLLNENSALNPDKSAFDELADKVIDIGKSLKIKNELNIQKVDTDMSEIILADVDFFNELAGLFNDDSIVTQIKQGLQLHSNPQDIFIDMFALPFEVSPIVTDKHNRHNMDFGTYEHTFENSFNIISKPKEIMMFETDINTIFKDWRDYQLNIYLYLPYCNIISLPVDMIMNKSLRCTFVFDVVSCCIKYFIKSANVTIMTVEGSVRYGLPLSASNNLQGFMQKLGGASQIISAKQEYEGGVYNMAGSIGKLAEGDAEGIGGLIKSKHQVQNSYFTLGKGIANILKPTPKEYNGNYSNSTAFYDELSAYLIIEQANIMYPTNIISNYNLPDNRVAKISTCTGYAQFSNVELETSATITEQEEILSLLASGVIV